MTAGALLSCPHHLGDEVALLLSLYEWIHHKELEKDMGKGKDLSHPKGTGGSAPICVRFIQAWAQSGTSIHP